MSTNLSDEYLRTIERLRAEGAEVFGPGPVQKGSTTPTKDDVAESPGMHVQIAPGSRLVEGFGGTADEAMRDALLKLPGYDPTAPVIERPGG
jgi:hypothetical protein